MTQPPATPPPPDYANWLRALALEEVCPNSLIPVTTYEFRAIKRLEEFGAKVLEKWALTTSYGSARSETALRDSVLEEAAQLCDQQAEDWKRAHKEGSEILAYEDEALHGVANLIRTLKGAAPSATRPSKEERYRVALEKIATMPCPSHTCKDVNMGAIAQEALNATE